MRYGSLVNFDLLVSEKKLEMFKCKCMTHTNGKKVVSESYGYVKFYSSISKICISYRYNPNDRSEKIIQTKHRRVIEREFLFI